MPKEIRQPEGEPRDGHSRWRIHPAYVALVAAMAFLAFQFVQRIREVRELQVQQSVLQAQNDAIQRQNDALSRSIRYYRTPAFEVEEARAILGYTMPGDLPVLSRPRHQVLMMRAAPPRPALPPPPSWQQWWNALTGSS